MVRPSPPCRRSPPATPRGPLAELTLERGITPHEKAPRLSVAAAGRADGGMPHRLKGLVGDGLRAVVAYRPLAVDGVEEQQVCVGPGVPPQLSPPHSRGTRRRRDGVWSVCPYIPSLLSHAHPHARRRGSAPTHIPCWWQATGACVGRVTCVFRLAPPACGRS